ncbi:hypothetical protein ACN4EK_28430 [Pantanalinema rosaneae CENA516]|uniref:hypothetical protein n=1 Tax=Pantanalinema rosaneae TaxID=1620701 RepID=UPI003D6F3EAE
MSPQPDIADGFQAEQTWRQLQFERHQRFLAQLKAEFYALRPLGALPYHPTLSVPVPAVRAAIGKHSIRSRRSPLKSQRSIPPQP